MKETKVCPKCQSNYIVKYEKISPTGGGNPYLFIRTGSFTGVKLKLYVCCGCGYCETWIEKNELEKVAESKYAVKI